MKRESPHDLDDRGILRKMEQCSRTEWKTYATVLMRRHGLNLETRATIEGTVLVARWKPSQSDSYRVGTNLHYGTGRYKRDVVSPAGEQLWLDIGVPGLMVGVTITATTKARRLRKGEPIVLNGRLGFLLCQSVPMELNLDPDKKDHLGKPKTSYRRWGLVTMREVRVDRKKTKAKRAIHLAKALINVKHSRTASEVIRIGKARDVPILAAVSERLDRGEIHLIYTGDNESELDHRRRELQDVSPETVHQATDRVMKHWSNGRSYIFGDGPPPKGDLANPWSPDETTEGKARRGDWVTANPGRLNSEGAKLLDVSSLGLHVGVGISTGNFWIAGHIWHREAKNYRMACLRFDQQYRDDQPLLHIDLDKDEVGFYEGDKQTFKLCFSASTLERVMQHAKGTWKDKIDYDLIEVTVKQEWDRAKLALNKRFREAGLLHLVPHLNEKTA